MKWEVNECGAQSQNVTVAIVGWDSLTVSVPVGIICVFRPKSRTSSSGVTLTRQKFVYTVEMSLESVLNCCCCWAGGVGFVVSGVRSSSAMECSNRGLNGLYVV